MEHALENYSKKRTTIVQSQKSIPQFKSPVFVVCSEPPYKTSFFRDHGRNSTEGAEKYFWSHPYYQSFFEKDSFVAMDFYMNMSYQLGVDINIFLYQWITEYVYF